jgi:hypothetical protein
MRFSSFHKGGWIAVFLLCIPSMVNAGVTGWVVDKKSGCKVWNDGKWDSFGSGEGDDGEKLEDIEVSWSGKCVNGKASGIGNLKMSSESVGALLTYWGALEKGKKHGRGTLTVVFDEYVSKYVGEFRNDRRNGQGTYTHHDGSVYTGQWKDDAESGQGRLTYDDGLSGYDGQWKNGHRHGKGTSTASSGDKYTGQWKNGLMVGDGTLAAANGDVYVGEWLHNPGSRSMKHGKGTMTYSDGSRYVGQWQYDKRHDQGAYTSVNGLKYVGQWKNDKFIGVEPTGWEGMEEQRNGAQSESEDKYRMFGLGTLRQAFSTCTGRWRVPTADELEKYLKQGAAGMWEFKDRCEKAHPSNHDICIAKMKEYLSKHNPELGIWSDLRPKLERLHPGHGEEIHNRMMLESNELHHILCIRRQ